MVQLVDNTPENLLLKFFKHPHRIPNDIVNIKLREAIADYESLVDIVDPNPFLLDISRFKIVLKIREEDNLFPGEMLEICEYTRNKYSKSSKFFRAQMILCDWLSIYSEAQDAILSIHYWRHRILKDLKSGKLDITQQYCKQKLIGLIKRRSIR